MPSFLVQTLGCKLNQLESEAIIDAFSQSGFEHIISCRAGVSPSVIIINTCTVTSKADQKARRVIRKALRDYPESCVIVTGCYAQLDKEDLLKLDNGNPRRLLVIKKDEILELIKNLNGETNFNKVIEVISGESKNKILNPRQSALFKRGTFAMRTEDSMARLRFRGQFEFIPEKFSAHTRSFLKIQDGCDNHCTYCRIRLARGSSISLEKEEVLSRLRILEKTHAEAVLTGVNICQYNFSYFSATNSNLRFAHEPARTGEGGLAELLDYLLSNTEKVALRLSSLEPEYIDENFAEVLSNKRIRPHFHLSIQAGSQKILQKMGRNYNAETIEKAVSLLRQIKDNPFLACDIITGFPGETESDFEETYNMCKKLDFAWIHVFPYSKRKGTPAYSFIDNVKESEVTRRVQLFTNLAKQGKAAYVQSWLGREVEVLMEKSEHGCGGVSENYLKVLVQYEGEAPKPGTVLRCRLIEQNTSQKDYDAQAALVRFL